MPAAAGAEAHRRRADRLRLRLSALGRQLSALARRAARARGSVGNAEAQSARRQRAAAVPARFIISSPLPHSASVTGSARRWCIRGRESTFTCPCNPNGPPAFAGARLAGVPVLLDRRLAEDALPAARALLRVGIERVAAGAENLARRLRRRRAIELLDVHWRQLLAR